MQVFPSSTHVVTISLYLSLNSLGLGQVPYSERWADELAMIMADKNSTSYFVQTKGGAIPLVAGGQPGELSRAPTSDDFPLFVISKEAEARQHRQHVNAYDPLET